MVILVVRPASQNWFVAVVLLVLCFVELPFDLMKVTRDVFPE